MTKHKVLSVTATDCELQTFTSGGPGGQHQNRSQTGVRWVHPPSGARGEARDERSQLQNKKLAWRRMAESKEFQLWLRRTLGQDAAREAEQARHLSPGSLPADEVKIEVRINGRWIEVDEASLHA